MRDLTSAKLLYVKAILFLGIGVVSAALIVIERPKGSTVVLLALMAWGFARAYYFAFYVIERYIDPKFRFSGLISMARHLWMTRDQ